MAKTLTSEDYRLVLETKNGKWLGILYMDEEDEGAQGCSLCRVYLNIYAPDGKECHGCPVAEATGQTGCRRTPYGDFVDAEDAMSWDPGDPDALAAYQRAAVAEIRFLESLLPEPAYMWWGRTGEECHG